MNIHRLRTNKVRSSDCRKTSIIIKNGVSSVACFVGFASCKTFGKQPKRPCFGAKPPYRSSAICATASCSGFVWLTASILAWSRGGSPTFSPARMPGVYAQRLCTMQSQQSIHSPSPRGRGLGLGIKDKHFFEKTYFFYKLQLRTNIVRSFFSVKNQIPSCIINSCDEGKLHRRQKALTAVFI